MSVATETLPLVSVLLSAAEERSTGQLSTTLADGEPARIYLDQGQVYSVVVRDGGRTLGERLVASGALDSMDLQLALAAQSSDVPGWRIGELVVHLGFVGTQQVQACLAEQMEEMLGWLLSQPATPWRFRDGSHTRAAFATRLDVIPLLASLGIAMRPHPVPAARVELPPLAPPSPAVPADHLVPEAASEALPESMTEPGPADLDAMDRTEAMAALRELSDGTEVDELPEKLTISIWRPFLPRQRSAKDKRGRFGRRASKD
jgi:hypothetical protein